MRILAKDKRNQVMSLTSYLAAPSRDLVDGEYELGIFE